MIPVSFAARPVSASSSVARRARPAGIALALHLLLALSPAQEVERARALWRAREGLSLAPAPAAADLDNDGVPEIILAGLDGRVTALEAIKGRRLWKTRLPLAEGDQILHSPVAGHFLADGTIDVVVVSARGFLTLLDGLTGQALTVFQLNAPLGVAPTAVPIHAEAWPTERTYRDGVALLGPGGQLTVRALHRGRAPDLYLQVAVDGIVRSPPMVGRMNFSSYRYALVIVSGEGAVTIAGLAPDSRGALRTAMPPAGPPIHETWSALGELDGDGRDDLVVADDRGWLQAFRIEEGGRLTPLWERTSILNKPSRNPVLGDADGDGRDDILIPRGVDQFVLVNGATGKVDFWGTKLEFKHDELIKSPPALAYVEGHRAVALFSDAKGRLVVLDLKAGRLLEGQGAQPTLLDLRSIPSTEPLAGPFGASDAVRALILGEREGDGVMSAIGAKGTPGTPAWLGQGGGPWRSWSLSAAYHDYAQAQRALIGHRVEERMAAARQAYAEGDFARAIERCREILAAQPRHAEAAALERRAWLRQHLFALGVGGVVALGLLALGLWRGGLLALRLVWARLADRALERNDGARAATLLALAHRSAPRHRGHLKKLADLYLTLKKFDEASAGVFEKARQAFPEDDRYVKALATAYSHLNRRDAQAAEAYADMVRVVSHPGPWAFVLGQTLMATGQDAAALEAFRKAMTHGFEDPALTAALAELYARLGITEPEILPTMLRALNKREADPRFLRVFCEACLGARAYDEPAQRAAHWLLKHDPRAACAHVILSTALLQAGEIKRSMMHAQAILEQSPNDSIGLRLLGACYAAEHRLDDTAMAIFRRALELNPKAPELLIAVGQGFIQAGREDQEAVEVYLKGLAARPDEETILRHVARIGGKQGDDALTIRAVEKLLDLGHASRELTLQLAEAYCRARKLDGRAEAVYRDALQFQPDHATIADQLAAIYAAQRRTDPEAVALFEAVFQRHPARRDVGKQLARAYAEAEMADRALALARSLLAAEPHDVELNKLAAHASASLDQMDGAIAGFEQVLARNPEDMETLTRLAALYGRKRRQDAEAIDIYQRAIREQPANVEIHAALARAWAAQQAWDQAVGAVQHLLSHAPAKLGQAIALMEELVEASPQAVRPRWFLVETMIYSGRLREALSRLAEIIRLDPTQAERALGCYDRMLDKSPEDARVQRERGRLLLQLGRLGEARAALENALRRSPGDESTVRDLMETYEKLLERRESNDLRFQLGRLAMGAGKYDLAIACFQRTDKDYRWENESVRHLAGCFMAMGLLDLAFQELRRLPVEAEVKDLLYELGQRYEAVNDLNGAREVYKTLFAADIDYRDVKGKLETLTAEFGDAMATERTAILRSLSAEAQARYELVAELGRGAMGIVYKARDNELEEMVALKILPDTLGQNPEALRRFRQEARNARRLSHPHIVRIHDIGEQQGRKYISMEFVDGTDLKRRLVECRRKLPLEETLGYARQIAEALAAADDAGIVHRDIKPANIMLTRQGRVKVADFGIAKLVEEDPQKEATRTGVVVGTPLYMAPEQVQGKPVDHRADLYAFGVVLYEMATGAPPFVEGDLAYHHVFTEPRPLPPELPEAFRRVVMKCLKKKPEERWQSAREILAELNRIELPAEA